MSDSPTSPAPEAARAGAAPEMRNTVKVRFARSGRNMDCDSANVVLRQGEQVIVDDRRGLALATVTVGTGRRPVEGALGRILRKADARDVARADQEKKREQDALTFALERARVSGLPIKLFRVDLAGGGDRATFFFSCEQRVDFRALVRELSTYLHARVEMRQVGIRDESKMTGGIGSCGRELCCSTYLNHFAPVSIKMAKHQRLVLNPTKIAGQCSRLKCCLVYEDDLYVELSKDLPKAGKRVETPEGIGRVDDLDVLGGRVRVSFFERPPMTFLASEVRLLPSDQNANPRNAPRATPRAPGGPSTPPGEGGDSGDSGDSDE